jgi:hypothetical protein
MEGAKRKLVIIGKVWPEPRSSAAGSRMMQLIELFQEGGWEITFASAAQRSPYSVDLGARGVEEASIVMNSTAFDSWIAKQDPAMVLFDRFMTEEQFGWRVAEQCPEAIRILDTEDLHALREGRHRALKQKRSLEREDLVNEIAKREVASIYRCDLSLMISRKEVEVLTEVFGVPARLLHYIPFLLDPLTDEQISAWPSFEERQAFISIGNFRHAPNWDAVRYLKSEIWPMIHQALPEARMLIYGAYPSAKVQQLHNPEQGFLIKGRADHAAAVMRKARVCVAPLRFGAGIKGKLMDAMLNGTPSITTSIGSESMHGELPWPGRIADDPQAFAKAAVALYTDGEQWQLAQQRAIPVIGEVFSKSREGNRLVKHIDTLRENLEEHRLQNFTGLMLHHQTMAATKYMSRWIEAKNS